MSRTLFFGAISIGGGEAGPFMAIEQAALTHSLHHASHRTTAIAWYTLCGSLAAALGALTAGLLGSYRAVFALYAAGGFAALGCVSQIVARHRTPAKRKPGAALWAP